ncbi:c-type cytochrome [Thalassomonas actiniarum]|uniref:Cytochrome c n=1 Tax=Thalassomonas actiniarum TaxID=485447 RepID=A0AAE9YPA9_9GAMM|nr:cytochrome c [Thalassomonas actiniarum]WDD97046.1 cytochrome c [Thalassomonas actiniarum]
MKFIKVSVALATLVSCAAFTVVAEPAKSLKHAKKATELRQSVFSLLGSNMGPLGAMARGKMPMDPVAVEKHATRINQLSLMIADYSKTDTSGFKVETEALDKIWKHGDDYSKRINDLTLASAKLQKVAAAKDSSAIKGAIGGVGKTCGGCHDDFKAE